MQMYHNIIIAYTVYLRGIGTVINYLTNEKQTCINLHMYTSRPLPLHYSGDWHEL